jgi:hypothetical protein
LGATTGAKIGATFSIELVVFQVSPAVVEVARVAVEESFLNVLAIGSSEEECDRVRG